MLVEEIKLKSKRNPNIFLVKIGGEEILLHSDVIVVFGIKKGAEVDNETLEKIEDESDYIICLNKATNYINSRLKTKKQLKDYLYQNKFKTATIKRVIDKLEEYNIINDKSYADFYIESNKDKLTSKKLKEKLAQKGITNEACLEKVNGLDDNELCVKTVEKFLKNKVCDKKTKEKLIRHLQYKGFSYDTIYSAMKAINFNLGQDEYEN